jgi:hypothetical protein
MYVVMTIFNFAVPASPTERIQRQHGKSFITCTLRQV